MESGPYDPTFHDPNSVAGQGRCSWHGVTCLADPVISFRDAWSYRQSGCERAKQELSGLALA